MSQLQLNFTSNINGYQLKKLADYLLAGNEVTGNEHDKFCIAASAFPRRVKDLVDKYNMKILITKRKVVRQDGRTVNISVYKIK